MHLFVPFLSFSLLHATHTNGFKLKLQGRHRNFEDSDSTSLSRRSSLDGSSPLANNGDISYYANVTLNGVSFSTLIDTGSADLWVAGTVPNSHDTGKKAGVTYAVGSVQGPIKTAQVEFAGFKVPNQAYLEVPPDSTNKQGTGLVGLGPHDNSNIYNTLKNDAAVPLLDTIFKQNTSTPNYLTVNLGRLEDPSDIFNGDLSIGEILPTPPSFTSQSINLDDITSQTKLPVTIVPVRKKGDQHFQILLDENGIIGPDNQPISFTSIVSGVKNPKQATAVMDTGFSLTQVPRSVADAFYSRHPGAEFANVTGIGATWIVPCDVEVNITFIIGGQRYPIHPLDATLNPKILNLPTVRNSDGDDSCIGMFQPFSFPVGKDPTYDIILGMSFIRNTYTLFNYGDFILTGTGNTTKRGDPYLQLLSTTNPAGAHTDFVTVRLDGEDTTDGQGLGPGKKNDDKKTSNNSKIFLGIGIAIGLLVVGAALVAFFIHRKRAQNRRNVLASTGASFGFMRGGAGGGAYSKLEGDHIDMHHTTYAGQPGQLYSTGGDFSGQHLYDAPTQPQQHQYPNPWETRH
ncbi:acid protease [Marasmius fiardii PR-910]|nr:acid protease [Marasmius fiardii PR-910]